MGALLNFKGKKISIYDGISCENLINSWEYKQEIIIEREALARACLQEKLITIK